MYPKVREKGQQVKGSRAGSHAHLILKKKDPAIGTYEETKAIEKTQRHNIQWAFSKSKKISFMETHIDRKKKIPGVGTYTNMEKSMERLSSLPLACKRRR